MWNDVGVVIQYNSDDEQSITVEFHDTATHHAIHVSNTLGHTLADLSTSAVLLACEADDKNPRYVFVHGHSGFDVIYKLIAGFITRI